ncbi:MAG: C25 family cysteine peptidase [Promethearchaeota archaeon]
MKKKFDFSAILFMGFLLLAPIAISGNQVVRVVGEKNVPIPAQDLQNVDYLIITDEDMVETLEPLAEWKSQKGLRTIIMSVDDISKDFSGVDIQEKIKNCINDLYIYNQTTWVLLAGDFDTVPTREAYSPEYYLADGDTVSCDYYYSDLDHDWDSNDDGLWGSDADDKDYIAEVYVGRLSTSIDTEMEKLVQNIIEYETDPDVGPWMTSALYAGAMLVFNSEYNDSGIIDFGECDSNRNHNFMADRLPENWTSILMAEDEGLKNSSYYYDLPLNQSSLQEQINNGFSTGMIVGHGNPLKMVRVLFETDHDEDGRFDYTSDPYDSNNPGQDFDVDSVLPLISTDIILNPINNRLGMYYLGGCSVGTFDYEVDSLSEYFLKTAAIGVIAGSQVVWGEDQWTERDHGGWYSDGLSTRFWEQLFTYNQPGKAFSYAKADYVADRESLGEDADNKTYYPDWEQKVLKQFNLLGDPEVNLWQTIPEALNITQIPSSSNETMKYVVSSTNGTMSGISVTSVRGTELMWKGLSDENGEVEVPFSEEEMKFMSITATENQYIPSIIPPKEGIPGYNLLAFIGFCSLGVVFIFKFSLSKRKQLKFED